MLISPIKYYKKMHKCGIDTILLSKAETESCIIVQQLSSSYKSLNQHVYSFETIGALIDWLNIFWDNEMCSLSHGTWTMSEEIKENRYYKVSSTINYRPWDPDTNQMEILSFYVPVSWWSETIIDIGNVFAEKHAEFVRLLIN